MLKNIVSVIDNVVEIVLKRSGCWPSNSFAVVLRDGSHLSVASSSCFKLDILKDFSILWGVPVSKTSTPKLRTRRYSAHRLFAINEDIIVCPNCGAFHERFNICGKCYSKVRALTDKLKTMMLNYDPYDERAPKTQDREHIFKFADDEFHLSNEGQQRAKIIDIKENRPAWFSKHSLTKWQSKLINTSQLEKEDSEEKV